MRTSMLIVIAVASMLVLSSSARSQTNTLSDRMLITGPNGVPIFDQILPETTTGPEPTLGFGGGAAPVAVPAGLPGVAVTLPGVNVVLLSETVVDPLEPVVTYVPPGSTSPIFISDAIISTANATGTSLPPLVMLLSDPNPDLNTVVTNLANAPVPPTILPETGNLQDMTQYLGSGFPGLTFPIDIQVQSDVPEPAIGTLLLLGSLTLLGVRRRAA